MCLSGVFSSDNTKDTLMTYPDVNMWVGEVTEPQPPEVGAEYNLQWVDMSDDLEYFGRTGL